MDQDLRSHVQQLMAANSSLTLQLRTLREELQRSVSSRPGADAEAFSQLQRQYFQQEQELEWYRTQSTGLKRVGSNGSPSRENEVLILRQQIAALNRELREKDQLLADTKAALSEAHAVLASLHRTAVIPAEERQILLRQQQILAEQNQRLQQQQKQQQQAASKAEEEKKDESDEPLSSFFSATLDAVNSILVSTPKISKSLEEMVDRVTPRHLLRSLSLTDAEEEEVGICVALERNDDRKLVFVNSVVKEGPAHAAGLKAGDIIREVNGKPMSNDMDSLVQAIRGPPGTDVLLTVQRPKQPELLCIRVTRGTSQENALKAKKTRREKAELEIRQRQEQKEQEEKKQLRQLQEAREKEYQKQTVEEEKRRSQQQFVVQAKPIPASRVISNEDLSSPRRYSSTPHEVSFLTGGSRVLSSSSLSSNQKADPVVLRYVDGRVATIGGNSVGNGRSSSRDAYLSHPDDSRLSGVSSYLPPSSNQALGSSINSSSGAGLSGSIDSALSRTWDNGRPFGSSSDLALESRWREPVSSYSSSSHPYSRQSTSAMFTPNRSSSYLSNNFGRSTGAYSSNPRYSGQGRFFL